MRKTGFLARQPRAGMTQVDSTMEISPQLELDIFIRLVSSDSLARTVSESTLAKAPRIRFLGPLQITIQSQLVPFPRVAAARGIPDLFRLDWLCGLEGLLCVSHE
jgi:hypothetical protein